MIHWRMVRSYQFQEEKRGVRCEVCVVHEPASRGSRLVPSVNLLVRTKPSCDPHTNGTLHYSDSVFTPRVMGPRESEGIKRKLHHPGKTLLITFWISKSQVVMEKVSLMS